MVICQNTITINRITCVYVIAFCLQKNNDGVNNHVIP